MKSLGKDRIYHVSISPFGYSAKEVASGKYDDSYLRFFAVVKKSGAKFAFRTMHEMNGSWYSWSGDPENFKKAWRHVYELSRTAGLDNTNILFIMSMNSQDLPSKNNVVGGEMVFCSPAMKKKTKCLSFEDYYPGDKYVDMMGITLYNWGRGRGESWAVWRSFSDLLNDNNTRMYARIKSYNKPLIIDEVGTTAVDFKGRWTADKAKSVYSSNYTLKNKWLDGMRTELSKHPDIKAVMYFNRDKTYGLTDRSKIGELDWAGLSLSMNKSYDSYMKFFGQTSPDLYTVPFVMNPSKSV